ncbi:MAG: ABC transporter ATP-binding protein [Bacillota bacterium]|jgi:branched-chain amino acid transport system ATP-binding protein|nr:ABC transporter ATP-binding protein [Bacillota bacterium]
MLDVQNLEVAYGTIRAVHGVSFSVDKGEIVTLIGANGAGKSTILRTISGVVRPRAGNIVFQDKDITRLPAHRIVGLGISHVPEGRKIIANLTVRENLLMGGYVHKDRRIVEEGMEVVFSSFPRLKERLGQLGGTLSGGEQQMLAIGRGLVSRPSLMLFDEPSMGLAPILVEEIFQIIQRINKRGTTVLLVEQNAYMALQVANRAYVLETGTIAVQGSCDELRQNPRVRSAYLGEIQTA